MSKAKLMLAAIAGFIVVLLLFSPIPAPEDGAPATKLVIAEDTTISAGSELIAPVGGILIEKGCTLTIEDGAWFDLNGSKLEVRGTLVIENKNYGVILDDEVRISADVRVIDGSFRIYDNINHRISNALPGEKIHLFNQSATVRESVTLLKGVELALDDDQMLQIDDDSVLTVEGDFIVETDTVTNGLIRDSAVSNDAILYAGIVVNEGSSLMIKDGARFVLSGAILDVQGTLTIENMDYGIKLDNEANISADVRVIEGPSRIYDNINHRISHAEPGESIYLFNERAVIKESLTLMDGVELIIDGGKTIQINNGCMLTVDGKFTVEDRSQLVHPQGENPQGYPYNGWYHETAKVTHLEEKSICAYEDFSSISVTDNGIIIFEDSADEGFVEELVREYDINAAYYYEDLHGERGDVRVVSVNTALSNVLDYHGDIFYLFGDLSIEDSKLEGKWGEEAGMSVIAGSEIVLKGLKLHYSSIFIASEKQTQSGTISAASISGYISSDSGTIEFNDLYAVSEYAEITEKYEGNDMHLILSGSFKSSESLIVKGIVGVRSFSFETAVKENGKQDAKFIVSSGAEFVVDDRAILTCEEVLVEGTITVTSRGALDVGFQNGGVLSVLGKLDLQAIGQNTSVLHLDGSLYVGMVLDDYADMNLGGSPAMVMGSGSVQKETLTRVTVLNGSTVDAGVLVSWMEDLAVSTEFYIDDALWCTVYAESVTSVPIAKSDYAGDRLVSVSYYEMPFLTNCAFDSWKVYDDDSGKYKDLIPSKDKPVAYVGQSGCEKVFTFIQMDIYNVSVIADQGIIDVSIDGVLLLKPAQNNVYYGLVEAGTHRITYSLANGYSGKAFIVAIDGQKTDEKSCKFTIYDDSYDSSANRTVISLSGIQKSGLDVDPDTHPDVKTGDDEELAFTDIILIAVITIISVMTACLTLMLNRK